MLSVHSLGRNTAPIVHGTLPIREKECWFKILPAVTPSLRERAYRLRYQVYCRERGFEDPARYPDRRENDFFDSRSVCSLLVNRDTGSAVGTVRLVLADPDKPESSFPIQQVCRQPLLVNGMILSLKTTAEISRFAVSRKCSFVPNSFAASTEHRRRKPSMEDTRLVPSLTLGLMKATLQMSRKNGITDWLAVMEPSLLRLLARFSIYFQPVGPLVEYHGMRQPCYANIRLLLERVRKERPDVWGYVMDSGNYMAEM